MFSLTQRQKDLLTFLATLQRQGDICPSRKEMSDHLGLASESGLQRLIGGLESRGAIRILRNRARAIEVTPEGMALVAPIEGHRFIPACRLNPSAAS
jgi:SOS-response transcriptional repressor LexA